MAALTVVSSQISNIEFSKFLFNWTVGVFLTIPFLFTLIDKSHDLFSFGAVFSLHTGKKWR